MMDTPSIYDWDGCGVPPDGGEYRQIGEGGQAHFHCEMCNREGNWSHVNAEGHLKNLKHHLRVTGQWHLLPSARPNGLTTQPAPDRRLRSVPGPPPGEPPIATTTTSSNPGESAVAHGGEEDGPEDGKAGNHAEGFGHEVQLNHDSDYHHEVRGLEVECRYSSRLELGISKCCFDLELTTTMG